LLKSGIAVCDDIRQAVRRIEFLKHLAAEEVRIESVIPLAASFVARGHAAHVERLIALSSGGTPAIL